MRPRAIFAVALLMMLAGCGFVVPHITAFQVAPGRICRFPATVTASWVAVGNPVTLAVGEQVPFSVPQSSPGTPVTVSGPASVVLAAHGYGTTAQLRRIDQQDGDFTVAIGGAAACDGTVLVAEAAIPAVPPGMTLTEIRGTAPAGRMVEWDVRRSGFIRLVVAARPGECSVHTISGGPAPPSRIEALARWSCAGMPGPGQPPSSSPPPAPSCGLQGQACCTAGGVRSCSANGLECQIGSNICSGPGAPTAAPRCTGAQATRQSRLFAGSAIDAFGCGVSWTYLADSADEADGCAGRDAPGAEIVHAAIAQFPFCRLPPDDPDHPIQNSVASDTDEHAQSCAAHLFGKLNPGTKIVPGLCPPR